MTPGLSTARFPFLAAGLLGLTGVAIGAMGAHALKPGLIERGMLAAFETGSRYHLFHALALLALGAWARTLTAPARWVTWTAAAWTIGVVLFSFSLYWLALGGPRWLGPITPIGGVALMAGWGGVLLGAWRKP